MKILVAYYSRTGKTEKVAKEISRILKTDLEEIIDKKKREGIFGFFIGARDAIKEKVTEIKYKKDPKKYDLIIIGTPFWAQTITPAIRVYLKNKFKKVAFFITSGSDSPEIAFEEMEKLSKKPSATLWLKSSDFEKKEIKTCALIKIKKFCDEIKK